MGKFSWRRLDGFTLAILAVVVLALLLPCRGESARLVAIGSEIAIVLLFFLQGARLSRPAVLAGILHWRLHLLVLAATFVIFPSIRCMPSTDAGSCENLTADVYVCCLTGRNVNTGGPGWPIDPTMPPWPPVAT